jgi:hypothetical protein
MKDAPKDDPFAAMHIADLRCEIKALESEHRAFEFEPRNTEQPAQRARVPTVRPSAPADVFSDRARVLWHGILSTWQPMQFSNPRSLLGGEGTVFAGVQAKIDGLVDRNRLAAQLPWAQGSTLKIQTAGSAEGRIDTLIASIGRQKTRDFDMGLQLELRSPDGGSATIVLDPDASTQAIEAPNFAGPIAQIELVISAVDKERQ